MERAIRELGKAGLRCNLPCANGWVFHALQDNPHMTCCVGMTWTDQSGHEFEVRVHTQQVEASEQLNIAYYASCLLNISASADADTLESLTMLPTKAVRKEYGATGGATAAVTQIRSTFCDKSLAMTSAVWHETTFVMIMLMFKNKAMMSSLLLDEKARRAMKQAQYMVTFL